MIPIHEEFHSWQGEGCHMGRSAYFIRTFGCPVHCPWCDSAGTWHPEHVPEKVARVTAHDLAGRARASGSEFTVITGGEPAIHNLASLTESLAEVSQPAHIETSGGFPLRGTFDWITLSPKRWKPPLQEVIGSANEFKVIVDSVSAIDEAVEMLGANRPTEAPIWLHPEWSRRHDREILHIIDSQIRKRGAPFRAGIQAHKYFGAR